MKRIILTQNQVALVDDEIFEELNRFKWYARKHRNTFYAVRNSSSINGKRHMIQMHYEIIGRPPKGMVSDHRNGCGIDNQRSNLRFVTNRQNCQNKQNKIQQSSQYPGICWAKNRQKWVAQIAINTKIKHLGYFVDELEAFGAYKQAVKNLGETIIRNH